MCAFKRPEQGVHMTESSAVEDVAEASDEIEEYELTQEDLKPEYRGLSAGEILRKVREKNRRGELSASGERDDPAIEDRDIPQEALKPEYRGKSPQEIRREILGR